MVSHCGMENYLSAFGITGDLAAEMITGSCSEYFTLERLSGGKFKSLTNSKWFPSEMIAKFGETYTMEIAGFGNVEVKLKPQSSEDDLSSLGCHD